MNFGGIGILGTNDTTDDSPLPFKIQNDGNAFVNVTINASDLWNIISNPSQYYQFKIDNISGEENSFNWQASSTLFTNMPNNTLMSIADLNYTDATDSAEIDINISVPPNEGSGVRSSTVVFTASLSE